MQMLNFAMSVYPYIMELKARGNDYIQNRPANANGEVLYRETSLEFRAVPHASHRRILKRYLQYRTKKNALVRKAAPGLIASLERRKYLIGNHDILFNNNKILVAGPALFYGMPIGEIVTSEIQQFGIWRELSQSFFRL